MYRTQIVTGGAGFIGSCYVLKAREIGIQVINLDKLTYSGNMDNLASLKDDPNHIFVHGDIGNYELVRHLLSFYSPDAVVNFAAESHVDRSILDPESFVRTNVLGTCSLLRAVLDYWRTLPESEGARDLFRFLHISTDEVFGSLGKDDPPFQETTPYAPNSPYSASKASGDHFVRAFHETYGLPTLITNCSNNYGPRQFPEKFIPLLTLNALAGKELPVYGQGENIRDWLHVEDHCAAAALVLEKGRPGQTYNIGGHSELSNIEVTQLICSILDELKPNPDGSSYTKQIRFVADRPGHDFRYAINTEKIALEMDWMPTKLFTQGLRETIMWYLRNEEWVKNVQSGAYAHWVDQNYAHRLESKNKQEQPPKQ